MRLPHKISTLLYCFDASDRVLLLERAQEPNLGQWSPCGGKLLTGIGESPYACACREAQEEIGLRLAPSDLHLTGVVSESGYLGQAHWLMFLFEVRPRLHSLPPPIKEGRFEFFAADLLPSLPLPQTDREQIWPLFWRHRGGFFAAHCRVADLGEHAWTLEESLPVRSPGTSAEVLIEGSLTDPPAPPSPGLLRSLAEPRRKRQAPRVIQAQTDTTRHGHASHPPGDAAAVDPVIDLHSDAHFMREALREARRASASGEVPVGAVVVRSGRIIARAHNQVELLHDATAHAEMLAVTQAQAAVGDWRLNDCTVYVTKEPCAMCAGALVHARAQRVVFGVGDPRAGAAGGVMNLLQFPTFNHRCEITAGVQVEECLLLLQEFFTEQRAAARRNQRAPAAGDVKRLGNDRGPAYSAPA